MSTTDASVSAVVTPRDDAQTPPRPASDAATPVASSSDASAPGAQATLPDWGRPLLGTYAARAYNFARDRILTFDIISRIEEISLVQIVPDGNGAEMLTTMCRYTGDSSLDELRLVSAAGIPVIRRKLAFAEDKSWSTDAAPWTVGYEREVPSDCVGKQNLQADKRPHQEWLTASTCACPASALVPPRADDCRVLDPDGDKQPGLTYSDKGKPGGAGSLIDETIHSVYVSRTHISKGMVDPAGKSHFGEVRVDSVAYQFPCPGSGCAQISQLSRPCANESGISLQGLPWQAGEPEWTCERILAQLPQLFPTPLPMAPTACTTLVLTDDPTRQ